MASDAIVFRASVTSSSARTYLVSAVILLVITGAAKVASSFGATRSLDQPDPVFGIPLRAVLVITGLVEILLATFCFRSPRTRLSTGLIAWFCGLVLTYRAGLRALGWQQPCRCLGTLTDALRIPPDTADLVMKWVLCYLIIGSLGFLIWGAGKLPHGYETNPK
jgi:hypothetical protein